MGYDYDNDDFDISDLKDSHDEFDLTDEELDQYDDSKLILLEQLEYRMDLAEQQLALAIAEGDDEDHIERLRDELELLTIDYIQYGI